MQPLVDTSERFPEILRKREKLVNNTPGYLPPEISDCIVELLPLDSVHCLATTGLNSLSISAWEFCFRKLNFVQLNSQQKLVVLTKLYKQRDTRLGTLKTLLRQMKEPLEGKARRLLLEEAIRRNDEDLTLLSLLHAGSEEDLAAGLILAVKHQRSDMIEYFLAQEAEIDADWVSGEPRSSLHIACDRGDIRLINLLLRYDDFERTILHVAANFGCYNIVESLQKSQEFERLKEMKNKYGRSPIHYAIIAADLQMVRLLACLGCSIHIQDEEGYNLLHFAVTRRMETSQREEAYKDLIKWLIAEGCDCTTVNKDGDTPFECAKNQDSPKWAVDILQMQIGQVARDMDTIEPMDTGADEAVPEAERVNVGQGPDHPIVISDDEEERHASRQSWERFITRRSFIPTSSRVATGLRGAEPVTSEGAGSHHITASERTRRIRFKAPSSQRVAASHGCRRSRRIAALIEGACAQRII